MIREAPNLEPGPGAVLATGGREECSVVGNCEGVAMTDVECSLANIIECSPIFNLALTVQERDVGLIGRTNS